MNFRTRLDFTNRQAKQYEKTDINLSGTSVFGVPYSYLTTGPDLSVTGVTFFDLALISTFSGNTGTTVYSFSDSRMVDDSAGLSALTPSNSGTTQFAGPTWVGYDMFTTADGYTGYTNYSAVTYNVDVNEMIDLGGGNYSGNITSDLYVYSSQTLDYSGRTIWVDVSGITRTEDLIVSNNPTIGYVLTCIDSEGKATWQPSSGGTSGGTNTFITGSSYNSNTLTLGRNDGVFLTAEWTGNTSGDCITDLYVSNIHSCSPLNVNPLDEGNMYFGSEALTIDVEGGKNNIYSKACTVLISDDYDYPTYSGVCNLIKGVVSASNWGGSTGAIASNADPTGLAGYVFGNYSGGTTGGTLAYYGINHSRGGTPPTGANFYRNKIVLSANENTDGMVIKGKAGDPNGTLWFEIDGEAVGVVHSSNGYWGFGLNVDGTEMPDTHLQVGGTGTTGSFKFLDGNEGLGKIMTSDSSGNVSWSDSTSGAFTSTTENNNIIPTNSTGNTNGSNFSSILGGVSNDIGKSTHSTIAGGDTNSMYLSPRSFIGGGYSNVLYSSTYSSIGVGKGNNINSATYSVIGGGAANGVTGSTHSFIGNGFRNEITSTGDYNSIINGHNNNIDGTVTQSSIIGGNNNLIKNVSSKAYYYRW